MVVKNRDQNFNTVIITNYAPHPGIYKQNNKGRLGLIPNDTKVLLYGQVADGHALHVGWLSKITKEFIEGYIKRDNARSITYKDMTRAKPKPRPKTKLSPRYSAKVTAADETPQEKTMTQHSNTTTTKTSTQLHSRRME